MIVHRCEQYSKEWDDLKRGRATASLASRIITPAKGELSKQMSDCAYELVADLYNLGYGMREEYVTAAMKNGTIKEPEARRWYEFQANCDVEEVGFCETDDHRFGCSPDGLVGEEGGLELKSPTLKTQARYLDEGGLPLEYKPQVHWSLAVTGRAWWDFMSYAPPMPPLRVRVEPDDYTKRVVECMELFWAEFERVRLKIESLIEPPPTRTVDFGELGTIEITPVAEPYF